MPTKEELENIIKDLEQKLKTSEQKQAEAETETITDLEQKLKRTEEKLSQAEKESLRGSHLMPTREKKIPKFTEDNDVEEWVRNVRLYISRKIFTTEEERVDFVLEHLDKNPKTEVRFRINPVRASAEDIFGILVDIYGIQESFLELQQDFYCRNQKPEESLDDYSHVLMKKLVAIEKKNPAIINDVDTILQQRFAEGVIDNGLKRELKRLIREQDLPFHKLRELANNWMEDEHIKEDTAVSESVHLDSLLTIMKKQEEQIKELTATVNEHRQLVAKPAGSYRGRFRGRRQGYYRGHGRNFQRGQYHSHYSGNTYPQDPTFQFGHGRGFNRGTTPTATQANPEASINNQPDTAGANATPVAVGYDRYCTYCHRRNHEERNCWFKYGNPWSYSQPQPNYTNMQSTNENHSAPGSQS